MIINSIIRFFQSDNELTINKLGKFTKKHVASKLDGDQILPPKVILEFEYIDDVNGFSFVDKISQWESLRLLDADDQVSKWVKELKNAIQNNKSVSFEDFGTFYMNPSGIICFDSDIIRELNSEYYGLSPVHVMKTTDNGLQTGDGSLETGEKVVELTVAEEVIDEVAEVEKIAEVENVNEKKIVTETDVEVAKEVIEEVIEVEKVTEEVNDEVAEEVNDEVAEVEINEVVDVENVIEKEIVTDTVDEVSEVLEDEEDVIIPVQKRKSRWLERSIFILIILGAIGLVGYLFRTDLKKLYDQQFNQNTPVETPTASPVVDNSSTNDFDQELDTTDLSDSETIETANTNPVQSATNSTPVNATITTPQKPVQVVNIQNNSNHISSISFEKGKFYVIAGSFGKKSDAIQHIKDKKLSQYNPVLLVADSRVRVCIGTYKTEAEATAFAKKIDQTFWVLK